MPKTPNEILAAELQKLATKATKEELGVSVVGRVARKLPDDAYQTQFRTLADAETALRTACDILQQAGSIREDLAAPPDIISVSAVVGSGFLKLNPTVVTVQVIPTSEHVTDVVVVGIAKEGLIKQHAGEKAAKAVAQQLAGRLGTAPDGEA